MAPTVVPGGDGDSQAVRYRSVARLGRTSRSHVEVKGAAGGLPRSVSTQARRGSRRYVLAKQIIFLAKQIIEVASDGNDPGRNSGAGGRGAAYHCRSLLTRAQPAPTREAVAADNAR
jgi:hypothetical protein